MIYGYSALRENAELNIQKPPTSKAVRNERLMRMASRSCIGGLKISAFLTSYLAFDFGLEADDMHLRGPPSLVAESDNLVSDGMLECMIAVQHG